MFAYKEVPLINSDVFSPLYMYCILSSHSIRPSTVRKRGSLRRKPRPPRKPPRKPDSFGRAATLLESISSDDQEGGGGEDGQTTGTVDEKDDDNVYSDVAIVNSKRRASNPLAQRPLPPPPVDQTPFRPNSRWRPEWDNDDEINGRRTQRSISFNVPESERLYNEPLIHRSRSISQTGSVASGASRSVPSSPSRPQPKQRRKPPKPRESAPIKEKEKKAAAKSKKPPIPSKPRPMLVRPDELRSVLESLKKVQLANKKKDRDPDDGGGYCLPPARATPPKPKPRKLALTRKLSVSLEDIASPRPDASESRASTLSRSYSLHLGMVEVTRDGDYDDDDDDVGERLGATISYSIFDFFSIALLAFRRRGRGSLPRSRSESELSVLCGGASRRVRQQRDELGFRRKKR